MSENAAYKDWEAVNGVKVYPEDELLSFNEEEHNKFLGEKPWKKDPYYFKRCLISAVALLKIVMHAKQGEPLEIMGILKGQTKGDAFIITDVISLPVEGTETRVNASESCDSYLLEYRDFTEQIGFKEPLCGWYHSHPSYKCWLSAIDVKTEQLHQTFQDPWVAIVIDPVTTSTNDKIEIGSFRAFPTGFKPTQTAEAKKVLPRDKLKDFGSCYDQYYTMKTEIFKTKLDDNVLRLLWHEYWINSLSATAIISSRDMVDEKVIDLFEKFQEERQGKSVGDACGAILDDAKEIQLINERGVKSLELKNILFNQKMK
ncbi:COP9 signalosome complex subunit, putative [Entamoeba invadens IP1]|uniref:COP9 signalosome complex subunit 5 n=1 Tax=Entamoeba invadens IP1 TaxID=370355 RepID=A0A0A1TZX4_ENTIV|nr:COP9 signalosome complex subunit, putative [Entamoeba invadens IP1]ELP85766.1 COP9 signalosome complex subunit, putative [Entamoeba invadens IP1]|eukprot:XP_004185112.1 COP9 signalosome complex subunit, putative [Entamoeba invadens IP1]